MLKSGSTVPPNLAISNSVAFHKLSLSFVALWVDIFHELRKNTGPFCKYIHALPVFLGLQLYIY